MYFDPFTTTIQKFHDRSLLILMKFSFSPRIFPEKKVEGKKGEKIQEEMHWYGKFSAQSDPSCIIN